MKAIIAMGVLLSLVALARPQVYVPPDGYVPDSKTAIRVAEAVLVPVYGEGKIRDEEPFKASLKADVWTVAGTLRCKDRDGKLLSEEHCAGGVAVVQLSKRDGRILSMVHYK